MWIRKELSSLAEVSPYCQHAAAPSLLLGRPETTQAPWIRTPVLTSNLHPIRATRPMGTHRLTTAVPSCRKTDERLRTREQYGAQRTFERYNAEATQDLVRNRLGCHAAAVRMLTPRSQSACHIVCHPVCLHRLKTNTLSCKSDVWLTVHRNSVWIRKTN